MTHDPISRSAEKPNLVITLVATLNRPESTMDENENLIDGILEEPEKRLYANGN